MSFKQYYMKRNGRTDWGSSGEKTIDVHVRAMDTMADYIDSMATITTTGAFVPKSRVIEAMRRCIKEHSHDEQYWEGYLLFECLAYEEFIKIPFPNAYEDIQRHPFDIEGGWVKNYGHVFVGYLVSPYDDNSQMSIHKKEEAALADRATSILGCCNLTDDPTIFVAKEDATFVVEWGKVV